MLCDLGFCHLGWAGWDSGAPAGMRAQPGLAGIRLPTRQLGSCQAHRVRVEVTRPPRPWFRTGHIPWVKAVTVRHIQWRGPGRQLWTAGGRQCGTTSSRGAKGVRGLWICPGSGLHHMREPGVEAHTGERESPQMELGAQVDSHLGLLSCPGGSHT